MSVATVEAPPALLGHEVPRVFTPPLRELTPETTLGFAVIAFAQLVIGLDLYPWQRWFFIHALELREDGSFRFRTLVLLVARQNGKSLVSQVLALFSLYVLDVPLVISTAQDLDTAEEVWDGAVELIDATAALAKRTGVPSMGNGKKAIRLLDGNRWKVKAASRRAGRGLSGDLVMLDELREHQTWNAWAAVSKTTMARANALIFALSNAGDVSSVVLRYLRKMAHAALGDPDGINAADDPSTLLDSHGEEDLDSDDLAVDEDTLFLAEWSAPPGCSRWNRDGWACANPSLGYGITERAVAASARTDPEPIFRTEVLCQWIDGSLVGPFPPGSWKDGIDTPCKAPNECPGCGETHPVGYPGSEIDAESRIGYCLDVAWDRSAAHIAAAGKRSDGAMHAEVIASRDGTEWVRAWFCDPEEPQRKAYKVLIQRGSPAGSLIETLEEIGVEVETCNVTDLGRACGWIFDAVVQGELYHRPQQILDVAAEVAATKPLSDSWVWDRKASPIDIAPMVAVTGAAWLASQVEEVEEELDPFFAFA
jgi:hypothetical protein